MNRILRRMMLILAAVALCGAPPLATARAFAVFAVPPGTAVTSGQVIDLTVSATAVPSPFGKGVPLTWKHSPVTVTTAFAPDPAGPLTNGTTTWNQNAASAMAEWNAVGANFSFKAVAGVGDPCVTDGVVVAAFDPTVCLPFIPSVALGLTRLVAIVDKPKSIRIADADMAIITPNTASASGAMITDAFDGLETFPNFDFRRTMLHELGHSLGLAHPDDVFGDTPATQATVMYSQGFVDRLSRDDKNGILALYPVGGASGGGGSDGLLLALMLGALAIARVAYTRLSSGTTRRGLRGSRDAS